MADELKPFDETPAFEFTQPPHPEWKAGDGMPNDSLGAKWKADEEIGWKVVDPSKEQPRDIYKLMISAVVPRPIAFVSSLSADGIHNLAPFSYFNIAHHDPPLVSVTINCRGGNPKDTARNIHETKQFTINIISEPFVEAANWCSVEVPADIDEWIGSGLTKEPSTLVKPPRVRESAFSMECELHQSIPLSYPESPDKHTGYLILGRIKTLPPISRMGDITYARIGEGFRIPRPQWPDVQAEYEAAKVKSQAEEKSQHL